jgi:hypothetical protein
MARLHGNGLQNGFTGKLGNLVGCKWKGIFYIRTRPIKVKHPNTEKQLAQRMRFSKTHEFLSPLKQFLRLGYGAFSINKTGYNAAMSYNMRNALTGDYPNISIDPTRFLFSHGSLPGAEDVQAQINAEGFLEITWSTPYMEDFMRNNDKVIILLKSLNNQSGTYHLDVASRRDGKATVPIGPPYTTNETVCYLIFATASMLLGDFAEDHISDSVYAGMVGE